MSQTPPPDVVERLNRHGQQHLLRWWDELADDQRRTLLEQIAAVDFELLDGLFARSQATADEESPAERARRAGPPADLVRLPQSDRETTPTLSGKGDRHPSRLDHASPGPSQTGASPLFRTDSEWAEAERRGRELLAAGEIGALLVAGGQGTRLGFPHPKGMFPIGPVSGASLFQILAEQLLARSRQAGTAVPLYVMTSDATHDETVAFFEQHRHFGLDPADIFFFRQGNMPAVDARTGRLLLDEKGRLSTGPDGHGGLLAALGKARLLDDMRRRGLRHLFYFQVDNPTAKVCDPIFLGFHALRGSEMSTKVVAKTSASERMGVVVELDGRTQIIEYSDLPDDVAAQTDEDGRLRLWAGNTAIHAFEFGFLERLVEGDLPLPFHIAKKHLPYIDERGERVMPEPARDPVNACKFERFIFDALPLARRALVVEADRPREFNPVKNKQGSDSPETARAALVRLFSDWLKQAGVPCPAGSLVEISPLLALDSDEFHQRFAAAAEAPVRILLSAD